MSNYLRTVIFKKVIKPLQNIDNICQQRIITNLNVKYNKISNRYSFMFPLKSNDYDVTNEIKNPTRNDLEDTFDDIAIKDCAIYFDISRDRYMKIALESNSAGVVPPLLVNNDKNIIIDFSSPNIAKPFHLGHLRSTIIGNYIANISSFLQNRVKKINYLGDWGTQFGLIQLGIEMTDNADKKIQTDPLKTLYDIYVTVNTLANVDPKLHERAKEIFKQLETGDNTIYKNWQTIRHYTVQELERTYKRLGVVFDEYHWESMYTGKNMGKIINLMEEMQLLTSDNNNRKVVTLNEEKAVPIIKSDGTTLYLTRDIAAAIDRFEKNKFDAMYYVVDHSQSNHFSNLIEILNKMKLPWANRLKHVKYGKIHGMSTRKGTAVFLEDILNEAKEIMKAKMANTKSTKVPLEHFDLTADILGISNVIIQDLKQSRINGYEFNWNSIFTMNNDGIKLQYTHCRLCSLEHTFGATLVTECDPSYLKEPEVDDLITLISQFDEIVIKSYEELEPCILTIYLLRLCKYINVAINKLKIKGQSNDLRSQRLLVFYTARITLAQGMKLLGLVPLEEM